MNTQNLTLKVPNFFKFAIHKQQAAGGAGKNTFRLLSRGCGPVVRTSRLSHKSLALNSLLERNRVFKLMWHHPVDMA